MVVVACAPGGIVCVRVGAAGAEGAGGSEGMAECDVWDRDGLCGIEEEDVDDRRDAADRDGPR
jgi:hypothetical protein